MGAAGIIVEYNPLHSGHLRLLEAGRAALGPDTAMVCVMSGNFVQRGDFALLRKHARARAAVESGADLVLELPLPWAVRKDLPPEASRRWRPPGLWSTCCSAVSAAMSPPWSGWPPRCWRRPSETGSERCCLER